MFCRNCGTEMNENAVVCVKCGCDKEKGTSFCPHCGKETNANADVCLSCGCSLKKEGSKSKMVAGLLGIFLGSLGIHNFYLGYTTKAIIQVLLGTGGWALFFMGPIVSGIWGLVEGILLLIGKINVDGKGNALKD
ncbi:TM2 domain-containing protein [Agathobaculum desmolans]|uniref:TM2 domain-containing protein n=2 Tax=Agathobaculum desmolans TaxID=39484 RepID=UPI00248DB64D|nr:TM2 domain-containing protein [Agathobaculum desmolans]